MRRLYGAHMRRILGTAALIAALSTAGCASSKPTAAPAPSPALPSSATQALGRPEDPVGKGACEQVAKVDVNTITDYKVMLPIMDAAAKSSTPEVVAAGEELGARYRDAILAKGTDDEITTKIKAVTAATELRTACIKAGLDD